MEETAGGSLATSRKDKGYINRAFDGMKSILEVQKSVLDIPYKSQGKFDLSSFYDSTFLYDEIWSKVIPAVEVRNGFKSYTSCWGKNPKPILLDMNMTVQRGTIYSLLGSSGCGKTTLLSCIVGMRNLDAGHVLICGEKPGDKSGVPGRNVGFMPQDIGLYGDFSIAETITYFGKLSGMRGCELETSRVFLSDLLNLPEQSQRVGTLSGGQKRRISLAVALVHAPPLIILDEPTVGVDPLLREAIWNHLTNLVSNKRTTVIVTTHYIEEAANSQTVGVMRGGRLLTEKSPEQLFTEFNTRCLQDVVLKLCHNDEVYGNGSGTGRIRSRSSGNIVPIEIYKESDELVSERKIRPQKNSASFTTQNVKNSLSRIRSLCMKNIFVMMRNLMLLGFVIVMPALQIILLGLSMGNDPKGLKMGVVNHELNSSFCDLKIVGSKGECQTANLSCRFLTHLPGEIFEIVNYLSDVEARAEVTSGNIQGFMKFPESYSEFMFERSIGGGMTVDNETLEGSMISLEIDATNTVITSSIQRIMYETYVTFAKGLLADCGLNPEMGGVPVRFEKPVFGDMDMKLQQFVAAGLLIGVALFFPLCSTAITFLWDKKQGTMERARVSGTQSWEIMTSFFITEGSVLLLQTMLCLFIFCFVFEVKIIGSVCLAFSLVALNGFAGISLGLLLASICKEEIQAILLAMAMMLPNFFLAGAMWPVEAMPIILQRLSLFFPGTLGNEAFRSIVLRGWGISHFSVWAGFASTFGWICFYWIANIFVHKISLANQ